jgi:hypothetical protein
MFKFFLWVILFVLLYRLYRNLVGPGQSSRNFQTQGGQSDPYQQSRRKPGETVISKRPEEPHAAKGKNEDDEGEYIDYKEIK